jgi:hypothetical protein
MDGAKDVQGLKKRVKRPSVSFHYAAEFKGVVHRGSAEDPAGGEESVVA